LIITKECIESQKDQKDLKEVMPDLDDLFAVQKKSFISTFIKGIELYNYKKRVQFLNLPIDKLPDKHLNLQSTSALIHSNQVAYEWVRRGYHYDPKLFDDPNFDLYAKLIEDLMNGLFFFQIFFCFLFFSSSKSTPNTQPSPS
jgi:hypothetical protein